MLALKTTGLVALCLGIGTIAAHYDAGPLAGALCAVLGIGFSRYVL